MLKIKEVQKVQPALNELPQKVFSLSFDEKSFMATWKEKEGYLGNYLAGQLGAGAMLGQRGVHQLLRGFQNLDGRRREKTLRLWTTFAVGPTSSEDKLPGRWEDWRRTYAACIVSGPGAEMLLAVQTYFALVVKLAVRIWLAERIGRDEKVGPSIPEPEEWAALEGGESVLGRLLGLNGENPFGWYVQMPGRWGREFWAEVVAPLHAELENILRSWRTGPTGWDALPETHQGLSAGQKTRSAKKVRQKRRKATEFLVPWLGGVVGGQPRCPGLLAQKPGPPPGEWADRLFRDHFQRLYEALLPRSVRRRWGEFPTPDTLARHVVQLAGYQGVESGRLLDPACGSGSFLMAALYMAWKNASFCSVETGLPDSAVAPGDPDGGWGLDSLFSDWLRRAAERIVGWDRNGLAVLAARANWLVALGPWLDPSEEIPIPVFQQDAFLPAESAEAAANRRKTFDFVVGNPPWLVWDQLEPAYREATMPLWRRYGLFSLSAKDARHGGAKKDLAALMTYAAADRYLTRGGRLAMLLPNTLLHTQGAGDGFRRFCLPNGTPLKVAAVEDFSQVGLFGNSAQRTIVLVLEKGQPTVYPVPYVRWRPAEYSDRIAAAPSAPASETHLELEPAGPTQAEMCLAEPIAPDRPSSPWWVRSASQESAEGGSTWRQWLGPADYVAYLGANTGGANEVFWFDLVAVEDGKARLRNRPVSGRGRRLPTSRFLDDSPGNEERRSAKIPAASLSTETVLLEPERLFPLVRWQDVHRWQARPSCWILLVQDAERRRGVDPDWLRRHCPATWEYLERWEARLRRRAAYRRYQAHAPFYSLYNVGPYTLSRYKVVWRRMDRKIQAAVLEPLQTPWGRRPIVPQETCAFIPTETAEEAYYLAALLNSDWVNQLVQRGGLTGTKGFGSPGMLRWLRLRRFDPTDAHHQKLAELAKTIYLRLQQGKNPSEIEAQINALVVDM